MSVPRLSREREAKLSLLEALASSQRAVARMLESTADLNARFPGERPEDAAALLARLAALQLRMCESLLGVKLRRAFRGQPAAPWLADGKLRAGSGGAADRTMAGRNRLSPTAAPGTGRLPPPVRAMRETGRRSADGRLTERHFADVRLTERCSADGRLTDGREPE